MAVRFNDPGRRTIWKSGVLLSGFIFLLFLPNLILILHDPSLVPIVRGIFVSGLLVGTVFAIFARHLWLACLLFLPFVALAPVEAYYMTRYGVPSDANIIATVFESNLSEASAYFGPAKVYLELAVLGAAAAGLFIAVQLKMSRLSWTHKSRWWVIGVCMGVPVLNIVMVLLNHAAPASSTESEIAKSLDRLTLETYATYPFGKYWSFVEYVKQWRAVRDAAKGLAGFTFQARSKSPISSRQIYVLVIGEASRRDHWSLFGYERPTNPRLQGLTDLVTIKDMITPWTASRRAVPIIVSRKRPEDLNLSPKEPAVSRVFQEAGFSTYWYSTQSAVGLYDSPISVVAFDSMQVRFFNPAGIQGDRTFDDTLLPPLQALVDSSEGNLFVVLHTMGSHQEYAARYPKSFEHFSPTEEEQRAFAKFGMNAAEVDAYDNSVLFTDQVLRSVIDTLNKSGAIATMFYVSDHGEMLPNSACTASGHGFPGLPVYQVPALFWYSEPYARAFPEKIAALAANRDKHSATDMVFESLVDMAGIEFNGQDPQKSLFSSEFKEESRRIHVEREELVDFDKGYIVGGCQLIRSN